MKQLFKLITCLTFLFSGILHAQSTWQWGKSVVGNYEDNISDVATDAQGNVYVCGSIAGSGTLGGLPFNTSQSSSSACPFVAKYNSSGTLIWSNVASFSGGATLVTVYPRSITVDKSGNVYMAMTATCNQSNATIDFGGAGGAVFSQCTNAIIIKLNQNGAGQWGAYTYSGNNANSFNAAQLIYDTATSKLFYGFSIARTTNGGSQAFLYNAGSSSANYTVDINLAGGQESIYGELNAGTGVFNGYYRIGGNDNTGGKEWIKDMKADGLGNIYIGAELLYGTNFYHNGTSFSITAPGGNPYMKVIKLNSSLTHAGSTGEFSGPTSVYSLNEISINTSGEPVTMSTYDGTSSEHVVEVRRFSSSLSSIGINTLQYANGEAFFSGKGLAYDASGNIWATVGTSATLSTATYAWSPSFSAASAINNVNSNNGLLLLKISSSGSWLDYSLLKEAINTQFSVSNKLLPSKVASSGSSVFVCGETYYNLSSGSTVLATGGSGGNGFVTKFGCDPIISSQPQNVTICGTQTAWFIAAAAGTGLTKQWKKNGVNVSGATGDTLFITNASAADTGVYTFSVTNGCGTSVSVPATLNAFTLATISNTGSVLYLPFTGGIGTDKSGNGLTGGGVSGTAGADPYGNTSSAMAFNGSQNLWFTNNNLMNVTNQLTVSMWFKATNIATSQRLIDKAGAGQNDNYMIDLYQSKIRVIIAGSAFQTTQTFNSSTWYHMIMVYDGANVKIYINGTLLQSFVKTGNCTVNSYSLFIGSDVGGTNRFTGSMDEIHIYTRALNTQELAYLLQIPSMLSQPQSVSRCAGTSATFSASATGTNLTYQWMKSSNAISGATASSFTIPSVTLSDTGKYTCRISSNCIYTFSDSATLLLTSGASIALQPQSVTVCSGVPANLAMATSGGSATYQWFKEVSPVSGANSSQLLFNPAQLSDSGRYYCRVITSCGTFHTDTVRLTINSGVSISSQPNPSQQICAGAGLTLGVTATGNGLSYQWKLNGNNISGASQSTYTKANFSATDTGDYMVTIISSCGSLSSNAAIVKLRPFASIVTQPNSMVNCEGSDINLFASGSEIGLTYQWYFNGNPISGAILNGYYKGGATSADSGEYYLVASGVCNSVNSNIVLVSINKNPVPLIQKNGNMLSSSVSGASYQWYRNTSQIPGAISQSYVVTQSGDYAVGVVSAAGCSGISSVLTVSLPNGIENANEDKLKLYPNPVIKELNFGVSLQGKPVKVEIYGMDAKVLINMELTSASIDVSELESGLYFIRVTSEGQTETLKFIKR